MLRSPLPILVVTAVAGTCGGDPLAFPSVAVTDSAGIPVFTLSRLPPWDDEQHQWHLELERAVPTEGSTPFAEPLIYRPQGYAPLPDGRLVVLDAGQHRLVVVAAEEAVVEARFGATGQGPGEIWSSNSLLWPEDEDGVWVLDPGNQRLSLFSTSGTLETERPVEIPGLGGFTVHRPSTREVFFWKVFFEDPDTGVLLDSIGRLDADQGRVIFFAPMPPRVASRRRNTSAPVLFAPLGWFAPVGSGVVVGRSDAARFHHYSDDGELVGIIQAPMEPSPIAKSDEPAILEEFYGVARGSSGGVRPQVGEQYPLFNIMWPVSDSLFALQQSQRATPGGETPIPAGQFVWRVFSTRGFYAGTIVLPRGAAQPYWIEDGRLIATRRDSLGVATIESYLLTPPA